MRHAPVRHGSVRHGSVGHGSVGHGSVGHGSVSRCNPPEGSPEGDFVQTSVLIAELRIFVCGITKCSNLVCVLPVGHICLRNFFCTFGCAHSSLGEFRFAHSRLRIFVCGIRKCGNLVCVLPVGHICLRNFFCTFKGARSRLRILV